MPFSLKNASATYQRSMMILFHDMIHNIVDDYAYDILAKSRTKYGHLDVIANIFDRLEEYKVRLNLKKSMFGVRTNKILGFNVSNRGIEVDPTKVKENPDMLAPSTLKQLRGLRGRLQSIRRFIAQLADKYHPF